MSAIETVENSGIIVSPELGYAAFDSDNHYYEAADAFTRHIPKNMARRGFQWIEVKGKPRVMIGGKLYSFIPNPTFDPVAKPGCLVDYYKGEIDGNKSVLEIMGELEPIRAEYRDRDARLSVMDAQGLEATWLFPTMAVGVEVFMRNDPEAALATFRAFNRWLDEDWGLNYKNRIYAVPLIPLSDINWALEELEWALSRGARVIGMRNGPVFTAGGSTSPGNKDFDPFWARVQEAGVTVATHLGDDGYDFISDMWESSASFRPMFNSPLKKCVVSYRAVSDFYAALVCHHVFERFPRLRFASIENGASWVIPLLGMLQKAHVQAGGYWQRNPVDQFREHISVTPFFEDKIDEIAKHIPAERILFGSDWPHTEGTELPLDFLESLNNFSAEDRRKIMRDNTLKLTEAP